MKSGKSSLELLVWAAFLLHISAGEIAKRPSGKIPPILKISKIFRPPGNKWNHVIMLSLIFI